MPEKCEFPKALGLFVGSTVNHKDDLKSTKMVLNQSGEVFKYLDLIVVTQIFLARSGKWWHRSEELGKNHRKETS